MAYATYDWYYFELFLKYNVYAGTAFMKILKYEIFS